MGGHLCRQRRRQTHHRLDLSAALRHGGDPSMGPDDHRDDGTPRQDRGALRRGGSGRMWHAPRARSTGPRVLRVITPSIKECAPAPLSADDSYLIRSMYMGIILYLVVYHERG